MHPIEKVHKMIINGNVLGPKGTWTSRTEALKKKRFFIKHVLNGEVEVDGQWVKLTELDTQPEPPNLSVPDLESAVSRPPVHFPPEPATATFSEPVSDDGTTGPNDVVLSELPPQPKVRSLAEQPEKTEAFQKETITIRTIQLGKETSLTISESRAGNALVAICSVQGFIDQSNADDFHIQLGSMLDFGVRFFIIDLEHTTLIGSAGWGVLAVVSRLIKTQQGHLMLCSMSDEIDESFHLLQFDEVIDARKTITDCLEVIQSITQAGDNGSHLGDSEEELRLYGESYDDLPLQERIKTIIAQNGPVSFLQIAALLKQDNYGRVKINPFRLFLLLRELNLETKWKRVRFYRSC